MKGEKKNDEVLLCVRIPDDDDEDDDEEDVAFDKEVVEQQNEKLRKEKTATKEEGKRKRGRQHECDLCEKVFDVDRQVWPYTCVFTRTRNRMV